MEAKLNSMPTIKKLVKKQAKARAKVAKAIRKNSKKAPNCKL